MAEEGPSAAELADAKSFLKGSFALRFDTSSKIASQLVQLQVDDLGIDYIEKRNGLIDAVTLPDIKTGGQAAARYANAGRSRRTDQGGGRDRRLVRRPCRRRTSGVSTGKTRRRLRRAGRCVSSQAIPLAKVTGDSLGTCARRNSE